MVRSTRRLFYQPFAGDDRRVLRGAVVVVDCFLASGCVNGDESQPGKRGRSGGGY